MIDSKLKYLVACSGGPDSMALLDIYHSKGYYLEVAHVNHHKRETAIRDERIVRNYCKKNNIKFHKYDLDNSKCKSNFQEFSRIERYKYFKRICKRNRLDGVLLGHQEDDVLETYLMQKNKNIEVNEFGLASFNVLYGVNVYRPLLNKSKASLQKYCDNNHIEYGIDETNLQDHYERNKVRHSLVEKLNSIQRKELLKEIKEKNKQLKLKRNTTKKFLKKQKFLSKDFLSFTYLDEALRFIFKENISTKMIDEIIRQLNNLDSFLMERNSIVLVKEYGFISYFKKPSEYLYTFRSIKEFKCDSFKITRKDSDKRNGCYVYKEDFPITIRNVRAGDKIKLRYGTKKLNRYFIDNKIDYYERVTYPIVLNNKGVAILVPGIGCDVDHYQDIYNFYVLK